MRAHGIISSFDGPFDRSQFWKQTGNKDEPSIRTYEATKTLAMRDLVFLNDNIHCEGLRSNSIVNGKAYRLAQAAGRCRMVGPPRLSAL